MSNEIKWTHAQKAAIEASNCDLLVSASAGSGKTAVLVQRILDHVTDDRYESSILEMLVVTFTNAAASQLRDKLNKAIKKAIALDPGNMRLRRQLRDLPRASISTINSFCLDVVRTHFAKLGLSASVRIADESENQLLMAEIMEQTIERFYDEGKELGIEDFASFCDNFAQLRDESLGEIFMGLYNKLYSQMEGFEILSKYADNLSLTAREPFDNPWGKELKKRTVDHITAVKNGYSDALRIIDTTDGLCQAYAPAFYDDIAIMDDILCACDKGYIAARESLTNIKYTRLGSIRGKDCGYEAELVKPTREYFKEVIKKLVPLYSNDIETAVYLGERTAQLNRELYILLKEFHSAFMSEKYKRGIVSFADCEALTLGLLCDNGEPTEAALEYRRRFKEIYIDEYQDVNSVQDAIFRMIAGPDTRFMVGDIKQSIYGFRGAEPKLFGDYRESFEDYTEDSTARDRGCKIFLSNNFRSAENIIKFANSVSRTCFEDGDSSIEYMDGDDLVYSNKAEVSSEPVTVAIIAKNEEKSSEAVYVCDRIQELLEKGIDPSDITILLRSLSSSAYPFTCELEKRGIPYYCDIKKEFFDNPEIMLALCWLNTIDNTRRDVFVCGIAKSPVYDFTLDELIRIRRECPSDTLYNSIKGYTENTGFEKGRRFIEDIDSLRSAALGKSAHEIIWHLIYRKGLMSIVTKDKSIAEAKIARNNLLLFYDYARNFENGEFKGVYNFLIYIQKVVESGQALPSAAAFAGAGNAVKIMTIHHSKGLEFPYCFLCSCDKNTSTIDMKNKLFFHPDFGIAAKIADPTGLILYDSYIMNALKCRIQNDNIDEEYRVLYVALTRAVKRLWITATAKDPEVMYNGYTGKASMLSMAYMTLNHSYIAWILASLDRCDKDAYTVEYIDGTGESEESVSQESEEDNASFDIEALKKHISFEYPHKTLSLIPAKMAVSKLYPDILDDIDGAELSTIIKPKVPFFAGDAVTNRGADIGNATHAFMQFCDFDNVDKNGVAAELDRLCEKRFLACEVKKLVNIIAVSAFFDSQLYRDIRSSSRVFREKRFNVNLPASDFTEVMTEELKGETVLVQGVIDCFFYDEKGDIVLIDYKTDSVKDAETLIDRYSRQLGYYKKALETITGHRVVKSIIYSFALNKAIEINR